MNRWGHSRRSTDPSIANEACPSAPRASAPALAGRGCARHRARGRNPVRRGGRSARFRGWCCQSHPHHHGGQRQRHVDLVPAVRIGNATPTATISNSGSSLSFPFSAAYNASGDLWVANPGNDTVVEFTPSQLSASGSPTPTVTISSGSFHGSEAVAIDPSGNLWVSNYGSGTLVEFTPSQLSASGSPTPTVTISATALNGPVGIDFTPSGNLWVANDDADQLLEFSHSQLATSGSPTPAVTVSSSSSSLVGPQWVTLDQPATCGRANYAGSSVVEFTASEIATSGSPSPAVTLTPNGSGSIAGPLQIAVDTAGDLWVAKRLEQQYREFHSRPAHVR